MRVAMMFLVTLLALLPAATAVADDDVNPEIANCEELRDEATIEQATFCSTHIFCKMVMKIQKACTRAKTFLNKLKDLSAGKSKIDSSDIFDAAAPSIKGDPAFERISGSIKSKYDGQAIKRLLTGKDTVGGKDVNWVYEGPVKDGKRDGTGVLVREDGGVFRGDFVEGKQSGMGDYVSLNHEMRRVGDMTNQILHGPGLNTFKDGSRYEGEFRAGVPDGKGTYNFADGTRIEGNFKAGKMNGHVVITTAKGNRFDGEAVAGKLTGGTKSQADGTKYVGSFLNGREHGQGTIVYANGDRFEGEFRNGELFNGTSVRANGARSYYVNGSPSSVPPASTTAATGASRPSPSPSNAQEPMVLTQRGSGGASGAGGRWPHGVEPGNLYIVSFSTSYGSYPLLVAARNSAEAAEYVQTGLNKKAELYGRRRAEEQVNRNGIVECTGPNWGAVIVLWNQQPGSRSMERVTAASCGARTPREAIQNASRLCASKRGRPCSGQVNIRVSIGHSGAKPWSLWGPKKPQQPLFPSFPNENLLFAALGASTQQHTYDFVTSIEEAISQFGKACGAKEGKRNYASCWITSKNMECVMTINDPGDGLPNWQKCVDVKLTADGYVE